MRATSLLWYGTTALFTRKTLLPVTDVIISSVNWIRADALNQHDFKQFFTNVDADCEDMLLHTAVW